VAAAAYAGRLRDSEPGLQETVFFDPRREAWGFGAHVCMIRIDRETGTPTIDALVLVDD
jgi:carbon-monoxide dehydrogenase large subunit